MFSGPLLEVEISIPQALVNYNIANGIVSPPPLKGYAIIDTGAFPTCVDVTSISSLGVQPVNIRPTLTPAGTVNQNTYPVHVKFPGTSIEIEFQETFSANLSGQNFNGQPILALVGRDILSSCILIYNGLTGEYSLSH